MTPVRVPITPDGSARNAGAIEFHDVVLAVPQTPSSSGGVATSGRRRILDGINLVVGAGTTVALLGRSGSGKTTLLRMVNGLATLTAGSVAVNGTVVNATETRSLRGSIGYVIQEAGLYPHMSLERNVAMPLELAKRPAEERKQRARELLNLVGLPAAQFSERMPWQLSGGQRQRAGVARALITNPKILLLDEPFGALDPLTRADMQTLLRDLLGRTRKAEHAGTTALLVTHDLQEAIFLADRVVFIDSGKVVADLPSQEVLASSLAPVQEYVRAVQRFEAPR